MNSCIHWQLVLDRILHVIYLCQQDDIPDGGAKGFMLQGTAIFAVRQFGAVYVYRNRCPHLGIELEWMPDQFLDSEGALIQCATHGALFTIDTGICVAGPCAGDALEAIPFIEKDNALYLTAFVSSAAAATESGINC